MELLNRISGGNGGGSGWVYITDIHPQNPGGSATGQVYQDAPGNTVLQEVVVSESTIDVVVRSSYPKVKVNSAEAILARDLVGGFYSGSVSIDLGGPGTVEVIAVTPEDADGAVDTVEVTLAAPPSITVLRFTGSYPTGPGGLQTELKDGDSFTVLVEADKSFDRVELLDTGAANPAVNVVASGISASVTMSAADRGDTAQALPAQVRVRDAVTGAWSATRYTNQAGGTADGVDLVTLNDLRPGGSYVSVVYPGVQQAIKGDRAGYAQSYSQQLQFGGLHRPNRGPNKHCKPVSVRSRKGRNVPESVGV
jgi:hypothetical protein